MRLVIFLTVIGVLLWTAFRLSGPEVTFELGETGSFHSPETVQEAIKNAPIYNMQEYGGVPIHTPGVFQSSCETVDGKLSCWRGSQMDQEEFSSQGINPAYKGKDACGHLPEEQRSACWKGLK